MKKIIAATGLEGLIGKVIQDTLSNDYEFVNLNEDKLDITDTEKTIKVINETGFDIFLHLAAFTNVDAAEKNRKLAWDVNVNGTENVFNTVKKKGRKFIYISTGFVFDGESPPFFEDSTPHPISYYGETKLEGERIVKEKGVIIRIDYPYGGRVDYKKDIVETFIDLLKDGASFDGITDQILTPTLIEDIALSIKSVIEKDISSGLFHIVGSDSLSGYDIIETIGEVFELDTSHVGKTTYEEFYKNKARRPKNSVMKSKNNDFHKMHSFRDGLARLKSIGYYKDL